MVSDISGGSNSDKEMSLGRLNVISFGL